METEKLTLEHLAPYLPYGLKIYSENHQIMNIDYPVMNSHGGTAKEAIYNVIEYQLKPILRPMSEAIQEYDKNTLDEYGYKEPNDLFIDHQGRVAIDMQAGGQTISWDLLSIQLYMNSLFEKHYDVFGLIEKGLAIDINTIDKK